MEAMTITINLYKVKYFEGGSRYKFFQTNSVPELFEETSLRELSKSTKKQIEQLYEKFGIIHVFINMKPDHDIECSFGQPSKLCLELSKAEQDEFWDEFNN